MGPKGRRRKETWSRSWGRGNIRWLAKEQEGQKWERNTKSPMSLPHGYFLLQHTQLGVVKREAKQRERNEGLSKNRKITFGSEWALKFLGPPPTIRFYFGKINTSWMTQLLS